MFARPSQTPAQLLAAAEVEGPESQNNLGIIYSASPDRAESDQSAATCFAGAAQRGHALAQYNLGLLHEHGRGVVRDHAEARKWFLRAASQGDSAAQFRLGLQSHRESMDRSAVDALECRIEALKWLSLAAEQGYHNAEAVCGSLILQMTHAQVTESVRRAVAVKEHSPRPTQPVAKTP